MIRNKLIYIYIYIAIKCLLTRPKQDNYAPPKLAMKLSVGMEVFPDVNAVELEPLSFDAFRSTLSGIKLPGLNLTLLITELGEILINRSA